ncbi:MAG: hypothetical protein Roseis3KO_53620 [Roseivirga sp.]
MKKTGNRKPYNFTEQQQRNDTHRLICWHFHTVGKSWKVWANRKFRRTNKHLLNQNLKTDKDIPFVRYRKYMWWDM